MNRSSSSSKCHVASFHGTETGYFFVFFLSFLTFALPFLAQPEGKPSRARGGSKFISHPPHPPVSGGKTVLVQRSLKHQPVAARS